MTKCLLALILLCAGCSATPQFQEVLWHGDFVPWAEGWHEEIKPLYPDAVVLHAHGNERDGRWVIFDRQDQPRLAEDVIADLKRQYPGQVIVIMSCNPAGYVLDIPGVVYAQEDVWIVPDAKVPAHIQEHRDQLHGEAIVGKIEEFTVND